MDLLSRRPSRGRHGTGTGNGVVDLLASGLAFALDRWDARKLEVELDHLRMQLAATREEARNLINSNFVLQQRVLEKQADILSLKLILEKNDIEVDVEETPTVPADPDHPQN